MQQEYGKERRPQWAQVPQETRQRHVLHEQQHGHGEVQEQQHVQEQQVGQEEFLQTKPQAVAEPPVYLSDALKQARREGHTAEQEKQRHTATRTGSLIVPAAERWRTQTHAGAPQSVVTVAPAQLQQGYRGYGDVHTLGVDCNVPFISSAAAVPPQQQLQRAELLLPPVTAATSSSLPVIPALRERQANLDATKIDDDRAGREEEDQNCSHSTRGSSSNSNCQHVGGVRRGEEGEWESEEGADTYSPRDAAERLQVTENVFGLHARDGAFADAAGRSSILATTQSSSPMNTAAAPSEQWDCTLRDDTVTSGDADSAALPSISSPFYRNVLSAEATSDSGGSITSPATSPATALSPHGASPAPPASPVAVLSARHSPPSTSSSTGPAAGFSHALSLPPVLLPVSSAGSTLAPHAEEEESCSTSSPGHRFHDKSGARVRGRTASQQARPQQEEHEGKKPRSNSTGGSRSNNSTEDLFFRTYSRSQPHDSASTPHPLSATVCSPSAATTSSLRPSPSAPAARPSLSTSSIARTSTATCGFEDAGHMRGLSSPVILTPTAGAHEDSLTMSGPRRTSWGRQLEGRGDPLQVVVENCIYRQEKVKQPDRRPVPLPNGEPLSGPHVLCSQTSQQQEELLPSRALPLRDWRGTLALPYNTEEAPPSPFSNARRRSIWEEDRGLPHATQKRGSVTSALAAMHIPAHFLPPSYLSAEHPRRACDAALDHADFSPPSPFFPSLSRSSTQDACRAAVQQASPYPQFSARTCAVHKQPHTFVYPFEVAEAAVSSPSVSLFQAWPQSTTTEPQQPVLTYYISNNGMGETVPYSSRTAAAHKEKRPGTSWLRWLWPWGGRSSKTQHQRGPHSLGMQDDGALPSRSGSTTTCALSSSPTKRTMSPTCSERGRSAGSSRGREDIGRVLFAAGDRSPAGTSASTESFPAAARLSPALQRGRSPAWLKGGSTTKSRRSGGGRGTFVLAAVSAALEIGCVWRFPSYCFRFGGATFLLAYVVLLLILGVPVLALEMALGQVFRGGQMKVLNLISPRLRGLAAATLLLSFFICAYYSIFVSWTLQFLFSSIRPSLPWSVTSPEAAICAAAGHDTAACIQATLPTPLLSTERLLPQQPFIEERGEDGHRQQPFLEQNPRRLTAEETVKKKNKRQSEDAIQSFCAWRKPLYSHTQGACVADDKLKARVFLYTDVLGIWEKNTVNPSAMYGRLSSAAASPPPPPGTLLRSRAETTSSAPTEGEPHGTAGRSAAGKTESTGAAARFAEGGTAEPRAGPAKTGAAADEKKSSSLKSTDHHTTLSFRRLASAPAGLEAGDPPRLTSVTRTTAVWSLTPLIAVGSAAVWMQIYLFSLRGYKPMTTFTYITALTPIVAMLVIAGLALSLDGASLGIQHLFSPSPQAFSILSSSTDATLSAPARRLRVELAADDMPGTSILSAGALPRRAAATPYAAAEEAARARESSGEQVGGNASLGSAAAPAAAAAAARAPFLRAAAASARGHEGGRSQSRRSNDTLPSVLSSWPRWLAAGSHTLWGEAAAQVFFSLGVFQGVVTAYASHKRLTENVLVDAAAAAVTNLGMSLLAAVATFAVAGHVAKGLGAVETAAHAADLSALQDVQGSQLVFVLYPLAFASLPTGLAQLTCVLCFLALLLLGLMSVVGLVQPLMGLLRRCSQIEKCHRWKVVAVVCAMGFITGIPFCTRGGLLLLEAADYHWTVVGLIFIGCCECIAFGWLYGVGRQAQCIGYLPLLLHAVTYWMAVLLAAGLLFLSPPPYNTLTTALAVSLSVAAAGAASALWCCPWKRKRRGNDSQLQQQQQQKEQDGLPTPKQEHSPRDPQTQQQLAKRKGKTQSGITEKGRVTFNNGCAGSGSSDLAASVDDRSSMQTDAHEAQTLHRETNHTSNSNITHVTGSSDRSSSSTNSEGAAIGSQGRSSSGFTEGNSTTNSSSGHAGSRHSGDSSSNARRNSNTANPSGPRGSSDHSSSSSSTADSCNTAPRGSSVTSSVALRSPSRIVSSDTRGEGRVLLREGQDRHQGGSSNNAAVGNSSDSSHVPNSSSSNGNGMNEGQRDAVLVLDTKKAAEASMQQQQQKRYRSPRGRSTRRKRGRPTFVLIKRNGEALSFTACMFWLFVGNVEHLRKNLNAITCSGYRVLRLWPPWSIVIRYIIPTILLLLLVQELPQLFLGVSRYSQASSAAPAAAVGSRSVAVADTPQSQLQQLQIAQQQPPSLQRLPSKEQLQTSQQQQQQQLEQEMLQRSASLPGTSVSWRSLVAVHAFTLGALFLLVGLIVLGLLLPHVWEAFIPKERRRPVSEVASTAASSRSLFSRSSTSTLAEATTLAATTDRQQS